MRWAWRNRQRSENSGLLNFTKNFGLYCSRNGNILKGSKGVKKSDVCLKGLFGCNIEDGMEGRGDSRSFRWLLWDSRWETIVAKGRVNAMEIEKNGCVQIIFRRWKQQDLVTD